MSFISPLKIPLHPNDICIALEDFGGGEDEVNVTHKTCIIIDLNLGSAFLQG